MKFYSIVNRLFTGVQAGVQGGHPTHVMESLLRKEIQPRWERFCEAYGEIHDEHMERLIKQHETWKDWNDNHRTLIILHGGFHQSIIDTYNGLKPLLDELVLPIMLWREDEETANRMATSCSFILPESVYDAEPYKPTGYMSNGFGQVSELGPPMTTEQKILEVIRPLRLAV